MLACLFWLELRLNAEAPQVASGTWTPAGSMMQARAGAAATLLLLPDCRVLITGGDDGNGPTASAELYDVGTGSFTAAAPMPVARTRHVSVLLQDGRVLVAGGIRPDGGVLRRADLYDPTSDAWTPVDGMVEGRVAPTASLLSDGRVLIAGGDHPNGVRRSLEIFDPASASFSVAGFLSVPRKEHAAAVLQDGRVLLAGGSDGAATLASTDIFNPADGTVLQGPDLLSPRSGASATTLLNGNVLVAGGSDGSSDLASAEVYDPAGNTISLASGALETPRRDHLAFLLPDNNNVLIVGGTLNGAALSSAELFASWNDRFMWTEPMVEARSGAAGSALHTQGLMLVAGGSGLASAELYGFATVKSDKRDYAPGETVIITGAGWQPGETVSLLLQEVPKTHDDRTLFATADGSGQILNDEFQPEAHDVGVLFYLTATGQASQAQITFTDADIQFTQCRNDSNNDNARDDCDWSTGAINQNNSFYTEGDAVPQRLFHKIETAGAHTMRFEYDFTKSSIYAYDFLTNVDETQSGSNLKQCGNLPSFFSNTATCNSLYSGATLAAIPIDPFDFVSSRENPATRVIRVGGVSSATVSFPSLDGGDDLGEAHDPDSDPDCFQNCGPSSVLIDVTFTTTVNNTVVGVWFGGHLAKGAGTFGWGSGFGASSILGAPFHISYILLDDDKIGNRDNQISANGVAPPPSCPESCDDGNACTTDTCDASTDFKCAHANNTNSCDDGNACTQTDTCVAGACVGANPVLCTALDQCQVAGVCIPTTGTCSNVNAPNGSPCNDGNSCTAGESCQAGTCTGGANTCGPKDPPTTTTVSCNPSTATRGPVPTDVQTECTAEVRDAVALGPFATGTVSFSADGAVTPFATCAISGSAQVQTCSVIYRTSAIGAHPIVATYGGDATHTMSTGATVFTVTMRIAGLSVPDPPLINAALALPGRRKSIYLEVRRPPRPDRLT